MVAMAGDEGLTIRPALASDMASLADLWQDLALHHVALDRRMPPLADGGKARWQTWATARLDDPTWRFLVAEARGQVVGFASGTLSYTLELFEPCKSGKIVDIYVAPDYRHQGAARMLLAGLTDWFRAESVDHLELNVFDKNQPGLRFWQSLGAEPQSQQMWLRLDWQEQNGIGNDGPTVSD